MKYPQGNKTITTLVIAIISLLIFGSLGFVVYKAWNNNAQTYNNYFGADKIYKLKNVEYTKAGWKTMRAEKVNKMSSIISKNKKGLLGAEEVYTDDSLMIADIEAWFELANAEGCMDNIDENLASWDWIEAVNNKLTNEQCSKSIVQIDIKSNISNIK